VEGCVYWGLLEAFIGANVLQESRLARIFLLLAKPFKWQACIVLQLLERCAQQENVPEFFLKGHGRQSYVPLTCQA